MLKIKEIQIKNFRSIVNETVLTEDMNVFVGLNDVGKSNVLKALNLFFNGETEIGRKIDFNYDYSKLAPKRVNKAQEISIGLEILVPDQYQDKGSVIWKKVWRSYKSEPHQDVSYPKGGKAFSERSKVPTALNRIIYKYVPAVRSDEYFKHLLGDLYTSASIQISGGVISKPTQEYSDALKEFTKRISEIVKEKIGIDSILTLPENQMDIFRELAFGTKDNQANDILLDYRGDGIKARHIPAILKFIAEINGQSNKGAIPYSTIWGYEEPENGIEMSKCFDLANEFYSYRDNIQLFVSTHSPAFYAQAEKEGVKIFSVQKNQNTDDTKICDNIQTRTIDKDIGLMPIVSPYIKEQVERVERLQNVLKENFLTNIETIMVEGKTDKYYLEVAINETSPELSKKLSQGGLRILTREESCGTTLLRDWALAWCLARFDKKLVVLFDSDTAADLSIGEIKQSEIYKKCACQPKLKKLAQMKAWKAFSKIICIYHILLNICFRLKFGSWLRKKTFFALKS